jgi:hypothetical protein
MRLPTELLQRPPRCVLALSVGENVWVIFQLFDFLVVSLLALGSQARRKFEERRKAKEAAKAAAAAQ